MTNSYYYIPSSSHIVNKEYKRRMLNKAMHLAVFGEMKIFKIKIETEG